MSEEKLFKSRPLKEALYDPNINPHGFHTAPVDIIIPFHGEHNKVGRLIEGIFSTVRTNRYQISLVDDGSPNSTFVKEFKKIPGVVTFRTETQNGFGAAVNLALKNTKQPYVLLLHSDVTVNGNTWLSKLGESLSAMRGSGVKMISPLTDNPMGVEILRGTKSDSEDRVLPVGAFLPLYCALCRRGLFKHIGLLKEYRYAGGEAEEFAARMRANGYQQGVCGGSWVHHEGRGTLKKYDRNKKVQAEMQKIMEVAAADIEKLAPSNT